MTLQVPAVRRSQVVSAAQAVHPINSVPYSMYTLCAHGYRNDCSGKVSEWFGIPANFGGSWGGLSTVTMLADFDPAPGVQSVFVPIPAAELKPGDIVGKLGPGTGGAAGHVRLFEQWYNDDDNDNRYWCYEQSGGNGPDRNVHDDLADAGHGSYRAYRYINILEGDDEMDNRQFADLVTTILLGAGYDGYWSTDNPDPYLANMAAHAGFRNLAAVEARINEQLAQLRADINALRTGTSAPLNPITPNPVTPNPVTPNPVTNDSTYTVQNGDNLFTIAREHGTTAEALYALNADMLDALAREHGNENSRDGALIYPETVLTLP